MKTQSEYELRALPDVQQYANNNHAAVLAQPVEFRGTWQACEAFAAKAGYVWRRSNNVFGGYFVKTETGDVLIVT